MINEISKTQKVGFLRPLQQRKNAKHQENFAAADSKISLAKYSSKNVKANYMTTFNVGSSISFGAKGKKTPVFLNLPKDTDAVQSLSKLPPDKLSAGHYYDELANDIAVLIGPNKNAILAHEDGVSTNLLTHNFTRNILENKYVHEGLSPLTTEVIVFDVEKSLEVDDSPYDALLKTISNVTKEKKVVFIPDFDLFVAAMPDNGKDPRTLFKEGAIPNTQIIGLMSKKVYGGIVTGCTEVKPEIISHMGKIDFDGLNAADTKSLLKKDTSYTTELLNRYKNVKIKVGHNALDELVDKAAISIDGTFPAKALKLLDLAVSSKLTGMKSHKPGATVVVTASDITKFFENHGRIVAEMNPKKGQFILAENVKTKMADVGGISTLKEEINDDILSYLKDPKKFAATGRVVPSGKLLTGPPGNGKTLLARAIAGEAGVPFIAASGSEFVEMFVGVGAQRMRELFENARKAAENSAKKIAIVFIDEIDAFAKVRGANGTGGGDSEAENTLNQLLTEMDGFNKNSKGKVFVLAATNRKEIIDPALLRFGRFDGGVEVTNPQTAGDRLEILNIHARNKKFASEADKAIVLEGAAKITGGMSGADLAGVMQRAAKVVSKRDVNQVITYNDMIEGYLQVIAGPIKKSELSDNEIKMVVRHEGGHAVLMDSLKQEKVSFITLDGRGEFLGAVYYDHNKEMPNFKSVIYSAATSYAGGHAEPGFDAVGHGAGVSGDLKAATGLIDQAIKKWGLGVFTPQLSIGEAVSGQEDSLLQMYKPEIKKDINLFIKTAQTVSKKVVGFHQEFLDQYMKRFEENVGKGGNNLSGEEFSKMREDWVTKTGRTKQFKALLKEVDTIVEKAQNANLSIFNKLLKYIKR